MESQHGSYGTLTGIVDLGKPLEDILPALDGEEIVCEGSFTWHIHDWSKLHQERYYSPIYSIGEYNWNLLLFPQGSHSKSLAIYLVPHPKQGEPLECDRLKEDKFDWYVCAQFAISLSKPGDDKNIQLINKSNHRFNNSNKDWGFSNFIDLNHLKYQSQYKPSGFLSNDSLNISLFVRILKDPTGVLWHDFIDYDSKKTTGFVGLKNQGATCYLNSLLQSYYFTKYFRKLVYQIPTEGEDPRRSVPLALQKSFFLLQKSYDPPDTFELTKSFGWDTGDAFTQHDIQELNRILMDRLENKMKGTEVEGKLSDIFVGRMRSFIKCINVNYESSRVEDFWDIQLNVKGLKGLQDSFQQYIEVEIMDGENQYAAQEYGLQDAKKGVVFESFPPVLHLQLKRFEYDFNYDQLTKINDRYEFPASIDLSSYLDPDIYTENPNSLIYVLHGVLVHTGDISTGHYYAMIKPDISDEWYRFDDDKVWRVTEKEVFDQNFGCSKLLENEIKLLSREKYQDYFISRQTSAYMLVYIKKDDEQKLLAAVEDSDVPKHVISSVEQELFRREYKKREQEELHLYCNVALHSIRNFIHYQGFDLSPNERSQLFFPGLHKNNEFPLSIKVLKSLKVKDVCKILNEKFSIQDQTLVRYWTLSYRNNATLRLDCPISRIYDEFTLDIFMKKIGRTKTIDLFIEESYYELNYIKMLIENSLISSWESAEEQLNEIKIKVHEKVYPSSKSFLHESNSSVVLLFLKKYTLDPKALLGCGYVIIQKMDKIETISTIIQRIYNYDVPVEFVEEYGPDNIDKLEHNNQIIRVELLDGDILAFAVPIITKISLRQNVISFYEYLRYRIELRFTKARPTQEEYVLTNNSNSPTFRFCISMKSSYLELAKKVAQYCDATPEYLRIYALYANGRFVLKSTSMLVDFLLKQSFRYVTPLFEYEILSIPLRELEHLRSVKFFWINDSYVHCKQFDFKIANSYTVSEFLNKIQSSIKFSDEDKSNVLLWTNCGYRFEGILDHDMTFESISDSFLIFGRVLPNELSIVNQLKEQSLSQLKDEESLHSEIEQQTEISIPREPRPNTIVIVQQYFKDWNNSHGISFLFDLIPGENFLETKKRLHTKFGLGVKEFSKIKLGVLFQSEEGPILKSFHDFTDAELSKLILSDILNNLDYICMDHPDRSKSQSYYDRPIMIKN